MRLTHETGERFMTELRQLCQKNALDLLPEKKKTKGLFETMIDGVWRHADLLDYTSTNLSALGEDDFRLILGIDLSQKKNQVQWTKKQILWDQKKAWLYTLQKESLETELFPKLQSILGQLGMEVTSLSSETLGGMEQRVWIEVRIQNKKKWIKRNSSYYEVLDGSPFTFPKHSCSCGIIYETFPSEIIKAEPFYYFDCPDESCKSTLVVKIDQVTEKAAA